MNGLKKNDGCGIQHIWEINKLNNLFKNKLEFVQQEIELRLIT